MYIYMYIYAYIYMVCRRTRREVYQDALPHTPSWRRLHFSKIVENLKIVERCQGMRGCRGLQRPAYFFFFFFFITLKTRVERYKSL